MIKFNKKDVVKINIKGQERRPAWERAVFKKALADGVGAQNGLRFQCRIAQDANEAFAHAEIGGEMWHLNPKLKAQFGRNSKGHPYLTVGLISDADPSRRYRLTWEGEQVPTKMIDVAVKHDSGEKVGRATVGLRLDNAQIAPVNSKPAERQRKNDATYHATKKGKAQRERDAAAKRAKKTFGRCTVADLASA